MQDSIIGDETGAVRKTSFRSPVIVALYNFLSRNSGRSPLVRLLRNASVRRRTFGDRSRAIFLLIPTETSQGLDRPAVFLAATSGRDLRCPDTPRRSRSAAQEKRIARVWE